MGQSYGESFGKANNLSIISAMQNGCSHMVGYFTRGDTSADCLSSIHLIVLMLTAMWYFYCGYYPLELGVFQNLKMPIKISLPNMYMYFSIWCHLKFHLKDKLKQQDMPTHSIWSTFILRMLEPRLVWLSGLSASLWTKGSPVQFPVTAHAWVAGQVPVVGGMWEATTHWCFFPSLPPFPSLEK